MAVGGKGPNNSLKDDKSISIFYNILYIIQICEMLVFVVETYVFELGPQALLK